MQRSVVSFTRINIFKGIVFAVRNIIKFTFMTVINIFQSSFMVPNEVLSGIVMKRFGLVLCSIFKVIVLAVRNIIK